MSRAGRFLPWVLVAGLTVALVVAAWPSGGSAAQPHTLVVTGSGSTRLAPDIVMISLGVQTQGPEVGEVVSENNRKAEAVMQAIQAAGVAAEDIQTAYFNVYAQQQYDEHGMPTEEITYFADNTLSIRLRALDQLGSLLQTALTRGANSVQSVVFSVEDPTEALDAARQEAVEDARAQAEQLAAGAGVEIVRVLAVGQPGYYPVPVYEAPAYGKGGGGGGGVPTAPGTLEYQAEVAVTFEIR